MAGPAIGRRALLAGAAASVILSRGARAQAYPDRPIKLVVPFPAGRAGRRHRAASSPSRCSPSLGQTVVIENRGGAGGAIGAKVVAAAEPDGYTLLFGNISSLVVHAAGQPQPRLRSGQGLHAGRQDLRRTTRCWWCRPDFPAKSVRELVAYAKANPGKLNYGSPGHGNASHLAAELFKLKTGIDIVHVPYKGGGRGRRPRCWAGRCRCLSATSAACCR